MARLDFLSEYHNRTQRNYLQRVMEHDKAECTRVARQWGYEYWDGPRQFGYGGYHYDGRWLKLAQRLASHYGLKAGDRVLDVGCGKGFLLYELTQAVPGIEVVGLDISSYAKQHAKAEVQQAIMLGHAKALPFADNSFDLVFSNTTLHNLPLPELDQAIREIERVGKGAAKFICVESYRNDREKVNLLYWQLTCESFFTPEAWAWLYQQCGYQGDWDFIFFE
ncbi:Methyltransferase type 11 [Magnetococcus marinus MC-1]|uniref:Methyltransferase type 11 n=1 Tax=Magnetococcus marinus (strain ATCC BAA-1437 / JCM 17883 / MC-1) TaxID=156889 RepID=A0L6I1_MAGMM|nr:class I SAM-dependent methyltransferase [Magnetococcus marinus]ABK43574.1 Methyltransferase type 11 [Magnetococcus marinus MC-1]